MKNDRLNGSCWLSVLICCRTKKGLPSSYLTTLLFAITLILFLALPAFAQQTWMRTYGGARHDYGQSVQQTSDGGYIIAGGTGSFGHAYGYSDVYLIKTNDYGDTLWTRTYGGDSSDIGRSVQQTSDSGYIIAGFTNSLGSVGYDFYLIKTDASGNIIWTRTYGGTNNDWGYSIQQTTDGGYIITGETGSFGAGRADVYLIKTNASGDTLWTRTYGGMGFDGGYSVQQTAEGGYIITGYTDSFGAGRADVYLIKTNASGDTLWTRTYGGSYDDAGSSVQQTSDGGFIIAGTNSSIGPDFYLIKTNASGDTLWTRTYGGSGFDYANSVRQTADGGYIITGYTDSYGAGGEDVYLIKTNASGDTLWTKTYGGTNNDYGYSVQQASDGGYIITGSTFSFGAGGFDVYLIRTDGNGNVGVETPVRQSDGSMVRPLKATPNPFVTFAVVPGQEKETFELYDIAGRKVGTNKGDRIGANLPAGVYFLKREGKDVKPIRVVKLR